FSLASCLSDCIFFQAEADIRVRTVTGVPTCALPISCRAGCARPGRRSRHAADRTARAGRAGVLRGPRRVSSDTARPALIVLELRSEERRVGKERRVRRTAYK